MAGTTTKHGQVFGEVLFPEKDTLNTGRPIRMIVMGGDILPPNVYELDGHETKSRPVLRLEQQLPRQIFAL
jgi:hypothetical protein